MWFETKKMIQAAYSFVFFVQGLCSNTRIIVSTAPVKPVDPERGSVNLVRSMYIVW
jgi:hypothetical protein